MFSKEKIKDLAVEYIGYCCNKGVLERTMDEFFDFVSLPKEERSTELYTDIMNQADIYFDSMSVF